jgi:hypothetical protein
MCIAWLQAHEAAARGRGAPLHDVGPAPLPTDGVVHDATPDFLGIRTSDGRYRLIHAWPLESSAACGEQRPAAA